MGSSREQQQAWRDWGDLNPLYAILTDPKYRHGGDVGEFYASGAGIVNAVLHETSQLGLAESRRSALDFGCGVGRLTFPLADHFDEVVGVDVSPTMIAKAQELHQRSERCRFVVNQVDDLSIFPSESFDFVTSLLVLQHLPSTEAIESFLGEFVRVLRVGGAIVFQLPTAVPAHRPPRPSWRSRTGFKTRSAIALRRVGFNPNFLYEHLDWVPEMTMIGVSEERVRSVLGAAGGRIVHIGPAEVDAGGTKFLTYYVTR